MASQPDANNRNTYAGAAASDPRYKAAQDRYATMVGNRPAGATDPAQLAQWNQMWGQAKQAGTPIQPATSPAPTGVAPPPPIAPTSVDPNLGPVYMPNQPANMAGAPINTAPPKPKAPTKKTTVPKTPTTTTTAPKTTQYTLVMPPDLYGPGRAYAQQIIDGYNKNGNNDPVAYMNARNELARVASQSTRRRYNDTVGAGHGGSGGGYTSSGPSSGGGRLA